MPTTAEYRYCARLGMTQAECARHLGISRAAVTKAKARLGLAFGDGMVLSQGRQWQMRFYRYPLDQMAVHDWCEVTGNAGLVAWLGNRRFPGKRFASVTRNGLSIVRRAA